VASGLSACAQSPVDSEAKLGQAGIQVSTGIFHSLGASTDQDAATKTQGTLCEDFRNAEGAKQRAAYSDAVKTEIMSIMVRSDHLIHQVVLGSQKRPALSLLLPLSKAQVVLS